LAPKLGECIAATDFPYLRKQDITPLRDDSQSQYAKDRQKKEVTKRWTVNAVSNDTVKTVSWIWKRLGEAAVEGDNLLQEGK
jgi:hypothetical protein